jgi:hypothetical protein
MLAVIENRRREDLFSEIFQTVRQWPELERKVFTLAHYHGQSLEDISRSLKLDFEEVEAILKQCERGLHYSLRNFVGSAYEEASRASDPAEALLGCVQDLKTSHSFAPKANSLPGIHRLTA